MQMAAGAASTVITPSILGILARRISLEVVPVVLTFVFAALLAVFLLSLRKNPRNSADLDDKIITR